MESDMSQFEEVQSSTKKNGYILKNGKAKLMWDFEFILSNITTSTRPDLGPEDKKKKYLDLHYDILTASNHRSEK